MCQLLYAGEHLIHRSSHSATNRDEPADLLNSLRLSALPMLLADLLLEFHTLKYRSRAKPL
jgi:hypothetical protein